MKALFLIIGAVIFIGLIGLLTVIGGYRYEEEKEEDGTETEKGGLL